MNEPLQYRTFSVDYVGGMLEPDELCTLHDAVVDLFEAHGRKVEGADDGPMEWHSAP